MGKNKRKSENNIERIEKKIRKLQKRLERRNRSCSSNENDHTIPDTEKEDVLSYVANIDHLKESELIDISALRPETEEPTPIVSSILQENEQQSTDNIILDSETLEILGGDSANKIKLGPPIHNSVADLWSEILTTGLGKEIKAELIKKYLTTAPSNCPNISAPQLNLEIKAALPESIIKKDRIYEIKQRQLAAALSSLGQAIDILLKNPDKQALKPVSDAARILCDHHYFESLTRRQSILSVLNKTTKDAIQGVKPDEFLFGKDLSERIKACKAVSRSAMDLKLRKFNTIRPPTPSTSSGHNQLALNWRGPSPASYRPQGHGLNRGGLRQTRPIQQYRTGHKTFKRT